MPRLLIILSVFLLGTTQSAVATQVIANWNVVPGQRISTPFKAGVVAFHEAGVDVEFRVNGGPVINVTDPTYNDRTNVYEYWITIDPSEFPDGTITLSATALPETGAHTSRVLDDLTLYANADGSLNPAAPVWVAPSGNDTQGDGTENKPFATIRKAVENVSDGGIIYLKAGLNYKLASFGGGTFTYWTTISAAPGLGPDEVQIAGSLADGSTNGRYNKSGIKWQNVALYRDGGDSSILYTEPGQRTWLDRVEVFDKGGRWDNGRIYNNNSLPPYITNSYLHDLTNTFGNFHRNNRIERIGSDTFRAADNQTVINVRVNTMDHGATSAHPDFFQLYLPGETAENIVFYNVHSTDMGAQGIFGGDGIAKDLAFVNVLLEKDPASSSLASQNSGDWQHVLLWHVTIVDQHYLFRGSAGGIVDYNIQNSVFHRLLIENTGATTFPAGNSTIDRNHIRELSHLQSQPMGTNATQGDPLFSDESVDNYRLQRNSPAAASGVTLPGVPADIDGVLYAENTRDRGAFSMANTGDIAEAATVTARIAAFDREYDMADQASRIAATFLVRPKARFQISSSADMVTWQDHPLLFSDINGTLSLQESVAGDVTRRFYRVIEDDYPWRSASTTPPDNGTGRMVTQTVHTDDRVMLAGGSTRWLGDANARVGNGHSANGASVYVLPVELPELAAGESISSATLSLTITGWNNHGDPLGNVDLYGITFVASSPTVNDSRTFVDGSNPSSNASAQLLVDNVAARADIGDDAETSTGIAITSSDFGAYVQALYDSGAQGGDYMFLTLAHDTTLVLQRYYIFSPANGSAAPEVTFLIDN